jgi:hypothetical protein
MAHSIVLHNNFFLENTEGAIQIDNLEKLAQDEDKQNKNTTQYVLDTNTRKQPQIIGKWELLMAICIYRMC